MYKAILLAAAAATLFAGGCVGPRIAENASSEPSAIGGRIVSAADGRPVAGATVELALGGDPGRKVGATTGADGVFFLEGLHEGPHEIELAAEDRRAARSIDLLGGATEDLGDVRLYRPVLLEGRVTLAGRPAAARVVWCVTDDVVLPPAWTREQAATTTGADGRFAFPDLLGRAAAILFAPEDGDPPRARIVRVDLPDGGGVDLELSEASGAPWSEEEPLFLPR